MRRQHNFIFAGVGTGCDPCRTLAGVPLLAELSGALQQLWVDAQVELDRTRHFNAIAPRTQIQEALSLGLGLHGESAHFGEHRPGQLGETPITTCRTL